MSVFMALHYFCQVSRLRGMFVQTKLRKHVFMASLYNRYLHG